MGLAEPKLLIIIDRVYAKRKGAGVADVDEASVHYAWLMG